MTLVCVTSPTSWLELVLTNLNLNYLCLIVTSLTYTPILITTITLNFSLFSTPGLMNPIAIIHPILLLLLFGRLFYTNTTNNILLIWFSLFLGGWWAQQEFNWGGWWNWDMIETPTLLLSIFCLYIYHISSAPILYTNQKYSKLVVIIVAVICINTRYINTTSIHSFINTTQFFEYKNPNILINLFGLFVLISDKLVITNHNWVVYIISYTAIKLYFLSSLNKVYFLFKVKSLHHYFNGVYFLYTVSGQYTDNMGIVVSGMGLSNISTVSNYYIHDRYGEVTSWFKKIVMNC